MTSFERRPQNGMRRWRSLRRCRYACPSAGTVLCNTGAVPTVAHAAQQAAAPHSVIGSGNKVLRLLGKRLPTAALSHVGQVGMILLKSINAVTRATLMRAAEHGAVK